MTARRSAMVLAGLVAAVGLAACGGEDPAPGADGRLTMSIGLAPASASAHLGIDKGFFDSEGLQIETTAVESPPARVAAVQSGSVDVVELPTPAFIGAIEKGLPLYALAAQYGYPEGEETGPYENIDVLVAAKSPVQDMGDLEDARIAVPARQDLMEILATSQIVEDGGDPASVEWVVLDFKSQVAALRAGRVDAILVPFPFSVQAQQAGSRSIASPAGEFFQKAPTTIWAVSNEVAKDPDLVRKLQQAIYRSNKYANEHPDELIASSAERVGIPIDMFTRSGAAFYFPDKLEASDLQHTADKMKELGFLAAQVDLSESVLS